MERRIFITRTGLAGVLAAGSAPAIVHAQTALRLRLASSFPKSLDTIFGAAEVFAKKVGERRDAKAGDKGGSGNSPRRGSRIEGSSRGDIARKPRHLGELLPAGVVPERQ
jgi:hypothetical protein